MIIHLIFGLIKKTLDEIPCIKMSHYFPKPCKSFEGNVKDELVLSSYAKKSDLKNATEMDTSNFALKSNLTSLKTEVHRLDIDKLVPVSVD